MDMMFDPVQAAAPESSTGEHALDGLMMEDLLKTIDEEEALEVGLTDDTDPDTFHIETREQAEYFLKKYTEAKEENERIDKVAQEALNKYTAKVTNWQESKKRTNIFEMEYFSTLLREYTQSQLKDGGQKSLKLINGKLGFRKCQPKFEYDESALTTFLQLLGDKTYLKEQAPKIDKAALKKAGDIVDGKFILDGREVPGIHLTPQEDKFTIS